MITKVISEAKRLLYSLKKINDKKKEQLQAPFIMKLFSIFVRSFGL